MTCCCWSPLAGEAGLVLPVAHDLLARLSPYAVEFRYLGLSAPMVSLVEAQAAVDAVISWSAAIVGPAA
jgi:hypothetical protein